MKKLVEDGIVTSVILTVLLMGAYLIVDNNFGLFVRENVTYSLVDYVVKMGQYHEVKLWLTTCVGRSIILTFTLILIRVAIKAAEIWIDIRRGETY